MIGTWASDSLRASFLLRPEQSPLRSLNSRGVYQAPTSPADPELYSGSTSPSRPLQRRPLSPPVAAFAKGAELLL